MLKVRFFLPKVVVTTYSDDDEEDLEPLSNRINRACKPYMPFIDIINICEKNSFTPTTQFLNYLLNHSRKS